MPNAIRNYELMDMLGSGALGVTYRARDTRTSATVALKVVHERVVRDGDLAARLRHEVRVASQLDHPNIARVLEQGDDRGTAYVISEFVEGETLRARLSRQGRLSEEDAHGIALCVAHALNAADANRVVHRDLRPENVLLGDDGRLSVSDFGLIQALDAVTPTRVVAFIAAPAYAAPELHERRADIRSDLFSLGVILFETLLGRVPLEVPSSAADLRRPALPHGDAALLRQVAPSLAGVVQRLLEKDLHRRYANPDQCIVALQSITHLESEIVPAKSLTVARRALLGVKLLHATNRARLRERVKHALTVLRTPLARLAGGIGAMAAAMRGRAAAKAMSRSARIAAAVFIAATILGGGGLIAASALGGGGGGGGRPSASAALKPDGAAPSRTPAATRTPAVVAARSNAASPTVTSVPRRGVAGVAATPPSTRPVRAGNAASPAIVAPPAADATSPATAPSPDAATATEPAISSPTDEPTNSPTPRPSNTVAPSATPSPNPPSATPTPSPSPLPTDTPIPTPTVALLCADVTGNGRVTTFDVQWISARVGSSAGDPNYIDRYDLNSDGRIDATDVEIARSQLGRYCRQ